MKFFEQLNLSKQHRQKMMDYFNELLEANKYINLTSIIDKEEAVQKHFIDSLKAIDFLEGNILDIGTGAGFPSIPLAIIKESLNFTLIDSVQKKLQFIKTVCEKLDIKNVTTLHSRIEDLPKTIKYDTVLTRGVGALNIVCEYALPFMKLGGQLIAYKGKNYEEEIEIAKNALEILGGKIEKIEKYDLFIKGEKFERALIIIKKIKECEEKYPRGKNKPRLQPL